MKLEYIQMDGEHNCLPILLCRIGFLNMRLLVDSGASHSHLFLEALERPDYLMKLFNIEEIPSLETVGIAGDKVSHSLIITEDSVKIDGRKYKHSFLLVSGGDIAQDFDGILGMDFLIPHRAIIDFHSRELKFV